MSLPKLASQPRQAPGIEFLACVDDDVTRETLGRIVGQLGWPNARVREGGVGTARTLIAESITPPGLLLVDLSDADDPIAAIDSLADVCPPGTKVLAIGAANDVGLYRRLLAMGVSEYFVKPISGEALQEALQNATRIEEKPAAGSEPSRKARLLAATGTRGGVGATTVTAGIGWCLAHHSELRVALLDLDLQFGNLALAFDLEPGRGLREALEYPERLDSLLLASAMSSESDRLSVLAAEEPLEDELHFGTDSVEPLLTCLGSEFDIILADLPRRLDGASRRVLAAADGIVVVTDLSLSGMRDTQRLLGVIKTMQPGAKPVIVANRVGAGVGELARGEFEKGIGTSLDFALPYDMKAAAATAARGKAMPAAAPSSKAVAEIKRLAERLAAREAPKEKPKSLFRRLWG